MALEAKTVPSELMIRFGWQTAKELGTVKTYQFKDAVATLDGDQIKAFTEGSPRDLTADEAQKYLGEQMASLLSGLTDARAKQDEATKEAADCRANATTLQAQVDSLTKQLTDAKQAAADLTTKLGALPQFIDDLKAAAGGEDKVQALIDGYKQQQAVKNALAQGAAVIDQLIAIGLTPSEISKAVADKLTAPQVAVEAATSLGAADAPASTS